MKETPNIKLIFNIGLLFVSALVVLSFWNRRTSDVETIYSIVRVQADAHLSQDLLYRKWAAMHGGVYVPVTKSTPPNEYLTNVHDRDIESTSGKKLTLLNPAYMTRQVHEMADSLSGVKAHITSLKPIRLQNAPDAWEVKALQSFERGDSLRFELDTLHKSEYFRYMRPLVAEQACLACHQSQGYKLGDVRGGLSISIPAQPYLQIIKGKTVHSAAMHILIFAAFLGLAYFSFFSIVGKLKSDARLLKQMHDYTNDLNMHNAEYQALNDSLQGKSEEYKRLVEEYADQNKVLDNALKKAEESDRLKTAFLCNMSHEIRTPMNGIVGFAQLLSNSDLDKAKHDAYLGILNDSCEQLLEVVNDILEISKIETGQIEISEHPLYLPSVIADLAETWRRKASMRNNIVSVIVPDNANALWVYADELKLNHLLGHLMSNAVKFTEFGSIVLTCGLDGDYFFVSVTDTGVGIPENMYAAIFERFRKGEPSQSYNYGGTGLGLAICQGYAVNMGGKIRLSSTVGHGSTFSYFQPLKPVDVGSISIDTVTEYTDSDQDAEV